MPQHPAKSLIAYVIDYSIAVEAAQSPPPVDDSGLVAGVEGGASA